MIEFVIFCKGDQKNWKIWKSRLLFFIMKNLKFLNAPRCLYISVNMALALYNM